MEHPLTPPPSFRALRVRARTRTRTISDENRCTHLPPTRTSDGFAVGSRPRKDMSTSPARGRTRSRVVCNGLTLNTNNRTRPHLSLTLPPCCSPPPSRDGARSPAVDDDLIFQMSPIQTQSPTSFCVHAGHEVHANTSRVEQSTMQTLSALWEKHKHSVTTTASQPQHLPRTPCKRARADTVTQHRRGFSDTHANVLPRRERRGEHRPQQSVKTLLDLSSVLHGPLTPTSPPPAEPFMYSFPSFESSPLAQARQARARRQASKAFLRGEYLTGGLELDSNDGGADSSLDVKMENPYPQRLGPIRARKLRIQSGESLSDDVDDTNFISHAFQSASLDPEKECDLDAEVLEDDYCSSQRSSSVSSSSSNDAASLDHSDILSISLLASFPVRPTSRSQTHSSSRPHSRRTSPSKISPEASASAMMTRGRSSRRTSAEVQQASAGYVGGDRRGRGRTPDSTRQNGSVAAAAAWTTLR